MMCAADIRMQTVHANTYLPSWVSCSVVLEVLPNPPVDFVEGDFLQFAVLNSKIDEGCVREWWLCCIAAILSGRTSKLS